jgi:glycine/D-amino acid oxidase-like deaminating enzyme
MDLLTFLNDAYPFTVTQLTDAPRGLVAQTHFATLTDGTTVFVKAVHAPLFKPHLVHSAASHVYLSQQLGDRINVYPVKGYSITVNLLDAASQAGAPTVSLLDDETKLVTSRLGAERFRVAGTAEFNGYNRDIRADRIKPLVDWVNRCFPGVSTRQVVPWAGLRPMMPDMMPRVGAGKQPNVFYNTGHGHLGWTLSAATADAVAMLVEDRSRTQRMFGLQPAPVSSAA